MKHACEVKSTVYEDLRLVPIHVLLSWCSTKEMVFPLGWCLHNILLSWCSTKEIGVFNRLVPTQYLVDLVLN
jgi:hypothetical protein